MRSTVSLYEDVGTDPVASCKRGPARVVRARHDRNVSALTTRRALGGDLRFYASPLLVLVSACSRVYVCSPMERLIGSNL